MKTRKVPSTRVTKRKAATARMPLAEFAVDQVIVRPDGYYWLAPDGKQEVGPFKSQELALADMDSADEEAPAEMLHEAEDEIGIADWIDPETGQPAEGQSPPRFDEE